MRNLSLSVHGKSASTRRVRHHHLSLRPWWREGPRAPGRHATRYHQPSPSHGLKLPPRPSLPPGDSEAGSLGLLGGGQGPGIFHREELLEKSPHQGTDASGALPAARPRQDSNPGEGKDFFFFFFYQTEMLLILNLLTSPILYVKGRKSLLVTPGLGRAI